MVKCRNRNYSLEFKRSSAKLASESDVPISKTAKDLGVHETTLYGWVKRYYPGRGKSMPETNNEVLAELKKLRKENIRLKQERDILKKAAAYFASETW